ncbi:MAG TPA: hypothetical protein VML53_01595 [Thermoplasmata archaeon]|nr:hypothetical protein [Thermoplasmata archaeon]
MRTLTESEARVISVLLASRPDRERERLRVVDVPRSTYHAVRRRAYEEGWLRDRYVPHPVPLGRPFVSFVVLRPYADKQEEMVRAVAEDPGTAVLWTGGQIALAVMFHPKGADARRSIDGLVRRRLTPEPTTVTVRADGPTVPVYFDFEGLWCNLVGLPGTLAYPHGLGGGMASVEDDNDGAATAPTSHQWWAIGELLRRPFSAADQGRGAHLVGPLGLPFSQRRLLERGWVVHRSILDPSQLPTYHGKAADQVVLLWGSPRTGARPEELFATLSRDSRVFPFLFVVGADRWLLGAMGGSVPPPDEIRSTRRPVLPTLREFLEGIEIVQEMASGFRAPVDHRYDRLLPPPEGGGSGPR